MTTTIIGDHTRAEVFLDESDLEDLTAEQIQEMVDHEAFTQPIRVMPDCHPGAGCVIGFTMALDDKVVPNVVGVDIGCGMLAIELDQKPDFSKTEIDQRIRDTIPMGWHSHDDQQYHIGNDFPWEETTTKIERLQESLAEEFAFEEYDLDYFKALCEKAGVNLNKAINQMGTLGGGNHFIEVAESEQTGEWWIVFHSEQYLEANRNTKLDYLEGEPAHGYLIDMAFCQTYAWENRRYMGHLVADALGVGIADRIHSPHNLIDFEDLVIRKGATRAHDGERLVVPYNMGEGSIILRGTGNEAWNRSAPHGAGRDGSRTWARETFSLDEFETAMEGVYSTSVSEDTLDESPMSYKDPDIVESRIDETGEIIDRLYPVINCKADW